MQQLASVRAQALLSSLLGQTVSMIEARSGLTRLSRTTRTNKSQCPGLLHKHVFHRLTSFFPPPPPASARFLPTLATPLAARRRQVRRPLGAGRLRAVAFHPSWMEKGAWKKTKETKTHYSNTSPATNTSKLYSMSDRVCRCVGAAAQLAKK